MRLLLALLFLTSCTQPATAPVCKSLFKSVSITSQAVATVLQCEDQAAIAADLSKPILKMGMCAETSAQSTQLSAFLCPQISRLVTEMSVNSIPANWKCTASMASDIIEQKITEACISYIK